MQNKSNKNSPIHFDGKKFFNPGYPHNKKLTHIIKYLTATGSKKWPQQVTNQHHAQPLLNLANDKAHIIYINHASFLLQLENCNILTDPIFSSHAGPFGKIGPKRVRAPGISLEALPHIDYVVISHNHYDHMDLPSLQFLAQKHDPLFIVPLNNGKYLKAANIHRYVELDWWESHVVDNQKIQLVPARHWSRRHLMDFNHGLWGGYWISDARVNIFFAGDTAYSEHFQAIYQRLGAPDVSLIPIGAYLPSWFMQPSHLNPREAAQAHLDLNSKKSIAMHHLTFKLSHEGIDEPTALLIKSLHDFSIPNSDFLIPTNGEAIFIPG